MFHNKPVTNQDIIKQKYVFVYKIRYQHSAHSVIIDAFYWPWPCSGRPKIRMDHLRPCCSLSSPFSSSSVNRSSSFLIVSSRSAIWRRSAAFLSFIWRRASSSGAIEDLKIFCSLAGRPARLLEWSPHHHRRPYHLCQPYWMSAVDHSNLTCHRITIQSSFSIELISI